MSHVIKYLAILIIAVFLVSLILIPFPTAKASPKTIVVPDDFQTIQMAINNANAGDTVYVKSGTYAYNPVLNKANKLIPAGYYGNEIIVNKSISLIGENSQNTIITPLGKSGIPQVTPIQIEADNVLISGFMIRDASIGIAIENSNCKIISNNIVNNSNYGVDASHYNNFIAENNITGSTNGIHGVVADTIICRNNITSNDDGIVIPGSFLQPFNNITISQNNILKNKNFGIVIDNTMNTYIYGNNISGNSKGLGLGDICKNPQIYNNYIAQNNIGVTFYSIVKERIATGYEFYYNDFVANNKTVEIPHPLDAGSWDNGTVGNYWSDYQDKYPYASRINSSGIWNTPYVLDVNNTDYFPLSQLAIFNSSDVLPSVSFASRNTVTKATSPTPTILQSPTPTPTVPELSWLIILPLLLSIFSIAVILRHRKQVKKL
jgi:parallel beta-helix repeat protein